MTDEPQEPVIESLDGADENLDIAESPAATRLSPYAVSAFVVAVLGGYGLAGLIYNAVNIVSFGSSGTVRQFVRGLAPLLAPLVFGVIGLWLSARADDEIQASDGRLGGVGFSHAARVLGMVVVVVAVLGAIAALLISPQRLSTP